MTFNSNEKGNKKYYEEIMYISSNYYIFKKRPKTKVHSLINVYRLDIILLFIMFIVLLFIPSISYLSAIPFTMLFIYAYLLVEAKYRLREYLKSSDSIIKIAEDGIENVCDNKLSIKLPWEAIEYIIINKYSICVLPKNFSSVFIFAEINTKAEIYKSLKKYKKLDLLIDNSNQYKE